ncbi:MAG: plastocyanin/azurin family copper-binding protein [Solirubrobacteraceae bacterium]
MKKVIGVLVLAGIAASAAVPAGAVTKPQRKVVSVNDNYYGPAALTVNKGSTIVWKWPADAGDVHDVKLGKHPAGAKGFWSEPGAAGYSFTRKLTVPGRYKIICTLHEEMTMIIQVRK